MRHVTHTRPAAWSVLLAAVVVADHLCSGEVLADETAAGDRQIELRQTTIDPQAIIDREHPILTPQSVKLTDAGLSAEEAQRLDVPLDAKRAQLSIGGRNISIFVSGTPGEYVYVMTNDQQPGRSMRKQLAWPEYASWQLADGKDNWPLYVQAAGGSPPKWIRYFIPTVREGVWQQRRIGLVDADQDGDYSDLDQTRLLIDVDGDGDFQLGSPTLENLSARGVYQLGSMVFAIRTGTRARTLTLDEADGVSVQLQNLAVGSSAPDFVAEDLAGNPVRLSKFRGKFVFVDIWATWCGPCIAEIPNVQAAAKKYRDEPIEFVGVSIDATPDRARQFVEQRELTYNQLWTKGEFKSNICKQYEVSGIPATFLIDPEGRLIATGLRGDRLEEILSKVPLYDTAEGRAYFEGTIAHSRLSQKLSRLQRNGQFEEAIRLIDQFVREHPQLAEQFKIDRTRRVIESELAEE